MRFKIKGGTAGKRDLTWTSPLGGTWKCGQPVHIGESQCSGPQAHLAGPVVGDPALATRHNHGDGHQVSVKKSDVASCSAEGQGQWETGC